MRSWRASCKNRSARSTGARGVSGRVGNESVLIGNRRLLEEEGVTGLEALDDAMGELNDRERFIVHERKLREGSRTLESLGQELNLSKERVRQLEAAAFQKMRKHLERHGDEVQNLLV